MKRTTAINGAAVAIVALGIGLTGCGSHSSSNNASSKASAPATTATTKAVAQKLVVLPADDGVFVLRLNADCLQDQIDQALPATIAIDDKTTIKGVAAP